MSTLFPAKNSYHVHKDETLLTEVASDKATEDMDVEKFEKLVLEVRTVAISRPANLTKFAETHFKSSIGKSIFYFKILPQDGTCL